MIKFYRPCLRFILCNITMTACTIIWSLRHCLAFFFILNVHFRNCGFDVFELHIFHIPSLSIFLIKAEGSLKLHLACDEWLEISHFIVVTNYTSCKRVVIKLKTDALSYISVCMASIQKPNGASMIFQFVYSIWFGDVRHETGLCLHISLHNTI